MIQIIILLQSPCRYALSVEDAVPLRQQGLLRYILLLNFSDVPRDLATLVEVLGLHTCCISSHM